MKRKTPLVSVVIANWNGGEMLRQCLESLSKIDYPNWELVLVDNGSIDGSEHVASSYQLSVTSYQLIKNKTNLGFAKANNQGYEKTRGKYILLLNNDTKVERDFLLKLVERMERDPSIGVIQPKIFLMDKPGYLDNAGSFLTRIGFLQHWGFMQKDRQEFDNEREIFSAKGSCMLIRKTVIKKVGLFDPDFVSYFEESDFCWRVWLAGFKIIFYPKSKIYHKVGFSSKRQSQIFVNFHSLKNMLASMIKNLEFRNFLQIGGFHILIILGLSLYYLFKLQFTKALMIWRAIEWNVVNLTKTLDKRNSLKQIRKKKDSEIFNFILQKTSLSDMLAHFSRVEANF